MLEKKIPRDFSSLALWVVFALASLLMFVWSVTGTIALRNGLELLLLLAIPFLCVDKPAFKRMLRQPVLIALATLTLWILFHNLVLAWEPSRAWYESQQWFKSMICLGLGVALACAPRQREASLRWRLWVGGMAAAWALHLVLNVVLKDWGQSVSAAMQAATRIGSRDMVSYLGTGLLALLLADAVARTSGGARVFPLSIRALWFSVIAAILLTAATLTRNALPIMAVEMAMATLALIGASATRQQKLRRGGLAALVLVLILSAIAANIALDVRWKKFMDSARIAWDIEGNTWWMDQTHQAPPVNAEGVPVDHSAYSRIAWFRGVAHMISEYPLGTGYDRNAFRRALMKHYGVEGSSTGHSHAGLMDFTLATGIPGGLLLVAALSMAIAFGWRRWRLNGDAAGLALALFVSSYLLRAAVDGIVRDHMLEQAMFVTGLLLAATAADLPEKQK